MYECVLCCRHWRRDRRRWKRGVVHWHGERDCGSQEAGCCYQRTGTTRWEPQQCLPAANSSQTRSRQLFEKALDEGIICSKLVIFYYYSSFAPCLWLKFSWFRSVRRRSFAFSLSCHRTSTGVSLSLCGGGGEESSLASINDQLVLRNCSVWLRNSFGFTMCYFVLRAWWGVRQAQPGAIHITSFHCKDNWYEWGRYWHKPASTKSTLRTYFQDEKELCDWWAGSVFCDRSH